MFVNVCVWGGEGNVGLGTGVWIQVWRMDTCVCVWVTGVALGTGMGIGVWIHVCVPTGVVYMGIGVASGTGMGTGMDTGVASGTGMGIGVWIQVCGLQVWRWGQEWVHVFVLTGVVYEYRCGVGDRNGCRIFTVGWGGGGGGVGLGCSMGRVG